MRDNILDRLLVLILRVFAKVVDISFEIAAECERATLAKNYFV